MFFFEITEYLKNPLIGVGTQRRSQNLTLGRHTVDDTKQIIYSRMKTGKLRKEPMNEVNLCIKTFY